MRRRTCESRSTSIWKRDSRSISSGWSCRCATTTGSWRTSTASKSRGETRRDRRHAARVQRRRHRRARRRDRNHGRDDRHFVVHRALIQPSGNVLAIHGLNDTANDSRLSDPAGAGRHQGHALHRELLHDADARRGKHTRHAGLRRRHEVQRRSRLLRDAVPGRDHFGHAGRADSLHARRHAADGHDGTRLHRPDHHQHDDHAARRGVQAGPDADERRHADLHQAQRRDPPERRGPAAVSPTWGHLGPDWEMDQDLVGPGRPYANTIINDLKSVPTISLVDAVERLVRRRRTGDLHQRLGDRARRLDRVDQPRRQRGLSDQRSRRDSRRHRATSAGKTTSCRCSSSSSAPMGRRSWTTTCSAATRSIASTR